MSLEQKITLMKEVRILLIHENPNFLSFLIELFLTLEFFLLALFTQLWRDQFNETDSGRFANMAKV